MNKPQIENAPGLVLKLREGGFAATWQARTDLVKAGYTPKSVAIAHIGPEPTERERAFISDQCNRHQTEMLVWGRGGIAVVGTFDGTIRGLIYCYQTDADSNYSTRRYTSRVYYDNLCRRIAKTTWTDEHGEERSIGDELVRDIKARTLKRWHEGWSANGRIAMGHSLVGMLRTLLTFGKTILEDEDCAKISSYLHDMRFKMAKPRDNRLTAEQAIAIRAKAHEMGLPSIAMAQAFQFDLMLRQKDVIGEWVPNEEPGVSAVHYLGKKWLRGITWQEIDANMVLRHTTSKRQKDIEINLKLAPMVMEEFAKLSSLPSAGPIVVSPEGRPWKTVRFQRSWRKVADACGIPKNVYNMDSRAGAISEATDAGADLEHVRHAATHSDIGMTQRYSRGSADKVANVMQLRAAHRNKPTTK